MKAQKKPDPVQIIAIHGAMTANECAEFLPDIPSSVVNSKLQRGVRLGKLGRRRNESHSDSRSQFVYYSVNGQISNREPEHYIILRTLGKPVEHVDGIY